MKKKFLHSNKYAFQELDVESRENGRFYITPEGNAYPSVTTIIGHGSDKTWLQEWEARVGKEEVERVSRIAAARGTAVHEIVELYLNNEDYRIKHGKNPMNIHSFKKIKPFLDKHIGTVFAQEVPLYSNDLQCAGRVDCIAEWDGKISIIDFKTSKRRKEREDIYNYFMQESAYAYMFLEITGKPIRQLVTVMTVDHDEGQIFIEDSLDWIGKFSAIRKTVEL